MSPSEPRIGYVLKMYPRFSETFVVTEILAREAQGEQLEIFSLRPPADGRFHEMLAAVRAPVTYLPRSRLRGAEVWDLLRAATGRLPRTGAVLDQLLAAGVEDAAQALELALLAEERGVEHLHAHFATVATTVARLAALLRGGTYSFTAHAKDIFQEPLDRADLDRKLRDAHHVVTVSDYNTAHLRRRFPARSDRVHRVYNGVALDEFAHHAGGDRRRQVVAVGRLVEKKGFTVLLDALARLAAAGHAVPCVIAGSGPLEADLRAQVERQGLGGLVRMPGPLPQSEIRALVAQSAVLAAPCVVAADGNADGLPTVLLEAMALGTPCVSTRVTGIPEAVRHGSTGLLTESGDAQGLADALLRLLDDAALRDRLGAAARRVVEAEFDARNQARTLRSLLPGAASPHDRVSEVA
jgi:glycosyltransferase involved in cell wall biosynthesis